MVGCSTLKREELCSMEIGWPKNIRHVAHVTFDRFNGFLSLPVELEQEDQGEPPMPGLWPLFLCHKSTLS